MLKRMTSNEKGSELMVAAFADAVHGFQLAEAILNALVAKGVLTEQEADQLFDETRQAAANKVGQYEAED